MGAGAERFFPLCDRVRTPGGDHGTARGLAGAQLVAKVFGKITRGHFRYAAIMHGTMVCRLCRCLGRVVTMSMIVVLQHLVAVLVHLPV